MTTKKLFFTGFVPQWIYDPPYHGKGECDSHGAVVKRKAELDSGKGETLSS